MDLVIVQLVEYAIWGAIVLALSILALVTAGAVHEGWALPPTGTRGASSRQRAAPRHPAAVRRGAAAGPPPESRRRAA